MRLSHFLGWKRKKLKDLQKKLGVMVKNLKAETEFHKCPHCKTGTMITLEIFGKRGPPAKYFMDTALTQEAGTIACD